MGGPTRFFGGRPLPLPADLQSGCHALAEDLGRAGLAQRSAALSAGYRQRRSSAAVASEADALAYALSRMPATYAAVEAALAQLVARAPGFRPRTLLDLGCGPGTASWAACEAFPSIEAATLVDHNAHFRRVATALAARHDVLAAAAIVPGDLLTPAVGKYDLVLLSYSATEVRDLSAAVPAIFAACGGAFLLVEPGTPRDYERLLRCENTCWIKALSSPPPARTPLRARSSRRIGAIFPCDYNALGNIASSSRAPSATRTRSSATSSSRDPK